MTAPEKIYCGNNGHGNLSYSREKVYPSMEEYIRKDALLEWARKEADKSFNSFAREELGMEAREKGLAFEQLIKHIESL